MDPSPYDLMQRAVDIVEGSPHPSNKIAATLAGKDKDGKAFALSRTNFWPDAIQDKIGTGTKIGNSSGTVHAETACIIGAPRTDDASMFVTDPPCPNCVKNMAEAGIKSLYIDHKGFDKDFAQRRGHHFEHMAMQICEHAGISVHEIRRKEQKLDPLFEAPQGYAPAVENPPHIEPLREKENNITPSLFLDHVKLQEEKYAGKPFAAALAQDSLGNAVFISAVPHPSIGYTSKTLDEPEDRYSFILEPVNRLIMTAARFGLKIDPDYLFSSRVPTARELVNMAGAGLTHLYIGDLSACRDEFGLMALAQLQDASIFSIQKT